MPKETGLKINMIKLRKLLCNRFLIAILFLLLLYHFVKNSNEVVYKNAVKFPYVVVHLDLKGAPPKLGYLKGVLEHAKTLGVNGILIEYEDTFPFEGSIQRLRGPHAYNKTELREFLVGVINLGMEVIPLVQTFGHMEYVLKHKHYENLRERNEFLDSICPSREESIDLIREIISQVMKFHMEIVPLKFIHIGCDEVAHINECKICTGRVSKAIRFVDHVNTVCFNVHELSPDTTILIWDDMMRGSQIMGRIDLPIQPVVWDYKSDVTDTIRPVDLHKYQENFDTMWIATAFKGADGKEAVFPLLETRFQNHFSWLKMLQYYSDISYPFYYNFQGIILTGWSRYTHLSPLCELLPTAIPSLTINLFLINLFKNRTDLHTDIGWRQFYFQYLHDEVKRRLDCDFKEIFKSSNPLRCNYYGAEVANELTRLQNFDEELLQIKKHIYDHTRSRAEMERELDRLTYELIDFSSRLSSFMTHIYSKPVYTEYVEIQCNYFHSYVSALKNVNKLRHD